MIKLTDGRLVKSCLEQETKQRKLVLNAFQGHITLNVRFMFHEVNTDLVAIPGRMTSQLHVLVNKLSNNILKLLHYKKLLAGGHVQTPLGQLRRPVYNCNAIGSRPQQKFSPEAKVKGRRKYSLLDDMDGREDEEEVGNAGSAHEGVSSKYEPEDGNCEHA